MCVISPLLMIKDPRKLSVPLGYAAETWRCRVRPRRMGMLMKAPAKGTASPAARPGDIRRPFVGCHMGRRGRRQAYSYD